MTKIYLCAFRRSCITLEDGTAIMFEDRSYGEYGSMYTTSDTKVQGMIERSPLFGSVISLYKSIGNDNPDITEHEDRKTDSTEYSDVTRVQDAIAVIKETCQKRGVPYHVIRSREKALATAKTLGLSFPNLQ